MSVPSDRAGKYLYKYFNETDKGLENSGVSKIINKFNLPEVENFNANFVYNYFQRDERVKNYNQNVVLTKEGYSDTLFEITTDKLPRYVNITFDNILDGMNQILNNSLGTFVSEFSPNVEPTLRQGLLTRNMTEEQLNSKIDYVMYEGAKFNKVYTGVELIDTNRENKIYTILKSNMFFKDIDPARFSQKESAQKLYDTLSQKGGLFGADKKLIIEAFNNIQSEGYEYAPTDLSIERANIAKDPISQQSFSVQFNNLTMQQLLLSSNIINDSVYGDELRALNSVASDINERVLSDPTYAISSYSDLDYGFEIVPVRIFGTTNRSVNVSISNPIPEETDSELASDPLFGVPVFVGYMIEKYEVLPDESTKLVYKKIIKGNHTQFVDAQVKYGRFYTYKVRTVFEIVDRVDAISEDGSLNQSVIAGFLLASDGVFGNVHTIERIPPLPPKGLRFKFDYVSLLPEIHWQFPLNKQRDIKKFQVFKRFSVKEPFTLIAELDFDDSISRTINSELPVKSTYYRLDRPVLSFLDKSHREGEKPIYAVACVDAHGYGSNYSIQVMIERDSLTNRVKRKIISRSGAPKPYPNIYINKDSFQDVVKSSGLDRMKVFFDPEYFKILRNHNNSQGEEIDLNFLAIDNDNFRYQMHFINIDNHKDAKVLIKIKDNSTINSVNEHYFETPVSMVNLQNLSFN